METPKINILADNSNADVPFELTLESLAAWLEELGKATNRQQFCKQICHALQALSRKEIAPKLRLALLENIRTAAIPAVKQLQPALFEGKVPLTATQRAHFELLTALYAALAKNYWRIVEDIAASPQQTPYLPLLAKASFAGLEALKRVLVHTLEVYERPYPGFWSSCYRFYQRAEDYHLLDMDCGDDSRPYGSIAASFKSLLLLYVSGPDQFHSQDLKALAGFLEQFSEQAEIHSEVKEEQQFFKFSLNHDVPPLYLNLPYPRDAGLRYLSTLNLTKIAADKLKHDHNLSIADHRMLQRTQLAIVAKNLALDAHRKSIRMAIDKNCPGIIGLDNILEYLCKLASGESPSGLEPAARMLEANSSLPNFQLLPLDDEEDGEAVELNDEINSRHVDLLMSWSGSHEILENTTRKHGEAVLRFGEFTLVDSNANGYGMLFQRQQIKAALGEYLALIINDEPAGPRYEIGIIRRIGKTRHNEINLGVQLFSCAAKAINIYKKGNASAQYYAVLLPAISAKQQPGIIYETQYFQCGDIICRECADTVVEYRIAKTLHSTSSSSHAELQIVPASNQ